jgi:glycosyltransferase involved in cell wall biosynthesis
LRGISASGSGTAAGSDTAGSTAELSLVRLSSFSGGAEALSRALRRRVSVVDMDLSTLARDWRSLLRRGAAISEARRAGRWIPWTRTAAWSEAIQRAVERVGILENGRPVLFIQTLPACRLPPGLKYWIYTDRVTLEGAAAAPAFRSRFTPEWLARERDFLLGARGVFVMGHSTVPYLAENYGVPLERVVVAGAGPITAVGPPRRSDSLRRLLFIGKVWDLKGGPELLAAFDRVLRELPHLELNVIGSEPPRPVPPGVNVLGRLSLEAMAHRYAQADLLAIPSHMEGYGFAVLEGLWSGLPCIVTTVGNLPWLVGEAGLAIPPGDVDALADAIRRIAADYPRYRERAIDRSRQLQAMLGWDRTADAIVDRIFGGRS